jgi:hypothetical protein
MKYTVGVFVVGYVFNWKFANFFFFLKPVLDRVRNLDSQFSQTSGFKSWNGLRLVYVGLDPDTETLNI